MKLPRSPSSALPRLRTVPEAAEALKLSERTVWRKIKAGEIPVHRFGRAVRITDDDLLRLIHSCRAL